MREKGALKYSVLCNGKQLTKGRLVCRKPVECRPKILVESLGLTHFLSVQMVINFL